jgi:hypothetical protein
MIITHTTPGGERGFTRNIYVPFTPTHIKISNMYFRDPADNDYFYAITSDLISSIDGRIGIVNNQRQLMEDSLVFTNDKPINGTYTFNADAEMELGFLTFTITFIKN